MEGCMQKVLVVVVGGLADHAVDGLGRRTPLQVAKTPNLDHLAMLGGCGLYHPTSLGEPVTPEYSLYIMLGNPPEAFPGRASFEALARGIELESGRVYFMAEPAFVENGVLVESRTFEGDEDESSFFAFLKENFDRVERLEKGLYLIEEMNAVSCSHPGVVGGRVSEEELPEEARLPEKWEGNLPRLQRGLQPLNRLLFYGCGRYTPYHGRGFPMDMLFYTDSTFFKGMVEWMGGACVYEPSEDLKGWLTKALIDAFKELEKRDGVFIYTDYIHRSNIQTRAWKRVEAIEEVDAACSIILDSYVKEDVFVVITSDVTVPSIGYRPCSGLPVPVIMMGEGVRRGMTSKFDEALAGSGSLGVMRGRELLLTIFSYIGFFCRTV